MPFTFAHPAIILPLNYLPRKYISITGLVIGSMAPDFEYFMRMRNRSVYSHTWTGILWFDLPLAILLCFMFHNIVRVPLIMHAPAALRGRIEKYKTFNWNRHFSRHFPAVIICVLAGAASHLLFDWFTHTSAELVKQIPPEQQSAALQRHGIKVYFFMTGTYSLLGMAAIGYAIWQLPHAPRQVAANRPDTAFWTITCTIALLVYMAILIRRMQTIFHFQDYFGSAVSSFLIALVGCSLYMHVKWRLQKIKRLQ